MVHPNGFMQLIQHVDITRHPGTHLPARNIVPFNSLSIKRSWATIGDLHANALKLMYFLVLMGAVEISEEDYAAFAATFNQEENASPTFDFSKLKICRDALIRLIGDELADRALGGDDFVLELTNAFKNGGGKLEILLSNHTMVFFRAMELALKQANRSGTFDERVFRAVFLDKTNDTMGGGPFTASLTTLKNKLKAGKITVPALIALYDSHKTSFKAFSYDYADNGELIIYSHAPISRYNVFCIAAEMYQYMTMDEQAIADQIGDRAPLRDIPDDQLAVELLHYEYTKFISDADLITFINIINRVVAQKARENRLTELLFVSPNKTSALLHALENRHDPRDNTFRGVCGHTDNVYGNRECLDNGLGQKILTQQDRNDIAQLSIHDQHYYTALSFTRSLPSPPPIAPAPTTSTSTSKLVMMSTTPAPTQQSRWKRMLSCFKFS